MASQWDSGDELDELELSFDALNALEWVDAAVTTTEPAWVVAMQRFHDAGALADPAHSRSERLRQLVILCELGGHARAFGDAMREAGVIDMCLAAMPALDLAEPADMPLLLMCCRTVRKIICPDRVSRKRVREVGGLPALIRALDSGVEAVAMEATHCIKNSCYGQTDSRNEVRELGGVHAMMRVLLTPHYTNATWRAAVALCGLSWANPANRDIITTWPGVMEAIELRLGQKQETWKTATGLRALRRHMVLRASGQQVGNSDEEEEEEDL
ncbi:hypothetical protein T492DRAFT_1037062 [Pavlovales sp. CCMP2436]|nr:hypothetical protein T492DRAFT_1037062 [Pavlovales sp. CCMP2436]